MLKFLAKIVAQIKNATLYSLAGLNIAYKEEFAFKLEVLLSFIALPAALFIGHSALERIALISSFLLVPIVELLNSAVETVLNRIDRTWNPLTKKAKDIGSAAVMVSIINAIIIWFIIIIPHN
jgi:diacylglycerol kinase (ATP)